MSSKQSIDRYQAIKYSNIVQPKLIHIPEQTQQSDTKLTGPRPHEINMDDMNAQSLKTNNHAIGYNEKDSRISFTDNQADKEIPKNDDNFQPNQDVVIDQTIGIMDEDTPKAFNLYRNKKLISHGMMDVALFSANANQLRYVLEASDGSAVYIICIILLLTSIFLQILVGVALLLSARYNVTNCEQRIMAFKLGNYVIVGIFLITVVNIFITSFGGPAATSPTILATSVTEQPIL